MIGLSEIEEKRSYSQLQALMKKLQSSVISPSVEHLKEIALETRSTNLSSRDLDVLYEYISKHQAQFLNITKVYLEHDIQNMNSECLNFIFIISSLVQCRKESEDNQNNTLSELSELNSSLEVMNYEIVDVKTQKIFDKLSESKLNYDKLYQLLTKKGKQSKFNYLACDYDANQEISIQNHRLGYVYTEIQRYQEALQTLNNVKEQSKEIPRFLIQTIINCNLAQQKILGPESLDQQEKILQQPSFISESELLQGERSSNSLISGDSLDTSRNPFIRTTLNCPSSKQTVKKIEDTLKNNGFHSRYDSIRWNNRLGLFYFQIQNIAKSYHYLSKSLKLQSNFPETCATMVLPLLQLKLFDKAFQILKNTSKNQDNLPMAVDYNYLGCIETQRGHYREAEQYFKMSNQYFLGGFEQNRQDHKFLIEENSQIFLKIQSTSLHAINYFDMGINTYRQLVDGGQIKRISSEDRHQKLKQSIELVHQYNRIKATTNNQFAEAYLYLTKMYLLDRQEEQAWNSYLKCLQIYKKQSLLRQPQLFLTFFQEMKALSTFILQKEVEKETKDLIQRLQKQIKNLILQNMEAGIEFVKMKEYDSAKITFRYLSTTIDNYKNYQQKNGNDKFNQYNLALLWCYADMNNSSEWKRHFEKEVNELKMTPEYRPLLTYFNTIYSKKNILNLHKKFVISIVDKQSYMMMIKILMKIQLEQTVRDMLQELQKENQKNQFTYSQLEQLGQLFISIKEYSKALMYLEKGLKKEGEVKNQYYLGKVITILNEDYPFTEDQQNIIQRLEIKKTKNSTIMIRIAKFYQKKGRNQEAFQYFEKAFNQVKDFSTFSNCFNFCQSINEKGKAVKIIQEYILKEYIEWRELDENQEEFEMLSKTLCDLFKKMGKTDPASLQQTILRKGTAKQLWLFILKKYIKYVFKNKRLKNDEYIAELIELSTEFEKEEETFPYILTLIEKYPRYTSFLKLKQFCKKKNHFQHSNQVEICLKCKKAVLKNPNIQLIGELFIITELKDDNCSIEAFQTWFKSLSKLLKKEKKKGVALDRAKILDLCSLLKASKNKKDYFVIYTGMIQFLNNKDAALKIYKTGLNTSGVSDQLSESDKFSVWFDSFLKFLQSVSLKSQVFLLSFVYHFGLQDTQLRQRAIESGINTYLQVQVLEKLKSEKIQS